MPSVCPRCPGWHCTARAGLQTLIDPHTPLKLPALLSRPPASDALLLPCQSGCGTSGCHAAGFPCLLAPASEGWPGRGGIILASRWDSEWFGSSPGKFGGRNPDWERKDAQLGGIKQLIWDGDEA